MKEGKDAAKTHKKTYEDAFTSKATWQHFSVNPGLPAEPLMECEGHC